MKDRIREIIESENLTAAKFADRLDINRAVVSHILNGRNNPSLEVVTKILSELDYINPDWLLFGTGSMYKNDTDEFSPPQERDLFTQDDKNATTESTAPEYRKENRVKTEQYMDKITDNQRIISQINHDKKITQIIIYYDDSSFETFIPKPIKN